MFPTFELLVLGQDTPLNAVWYNVMIREAAGQAAISTPFSIGVIAAFVAFTIPIAIRGFIVGNWFRPGPWNLGRYFRPTDYAACAFVDIMLPNLCFPPYIPVFSGAF